MIYEHVNKGSEEDSTSNSMTNGDVAGLLYRNAIMKSFYNLVLEIQENKEAQQIMWKWLDIGVERVHQCVGKLNLNSNAETIENNFMQTEENECSKIYNPLLAKTKGMSSVRKKGHFEKRKRSTAKAHTKKEKHNEDSGYDAIDSPMGEQTNVLNCTNEPSGAVSASFNTPQQQQHPSCCGLNATSTSFSNLLQGMNSSNYLRQESYNYSWLPPNSNSQDKQLPFDFRMEVLDDTMEILCVM